MKQRTRTLYGIIALVVLTISSAEGVWAVVCMAGGESSVATSLDARAGHHHGGAHDDAERGAEPSHHGSSECPLGSTAGARGCMPAASLPAAIVLTLPLTPERSDALASAFLAPSLLLGADHFRPPQA